MAQTALTFGMKHNLIQNRSYAMPAKAAASVGVQPSNATLEGSIDETNWNAITLNGASAEPACAFIRTTQTNVSIILKPRG